MLSYIDCFWVLAIAFVLMVPMALMMRNNRGVVPGMPAH